MNRLILYLAFFICGSMPMFSEENISNHLVDMGLPSGTLWLDHNLGANTSFDSGEYYLGSENNFVESLLGEGFSVPTRDQFQELIDSTDHYWSELSGVKGMIFIADNGNSVFLPAVAQLWWDDEDEDGEGVWASNNSGSGAYWTCTPSKYEDYIYFVEFNDESGNRAFFGDRNKTTNRLPVRPVYGGTSTNVIENKVVDFVVKIVDNSILLNADAPTSSFYYELYNVEGQTINKGVSTETASIGNLPKGVYLLNVTLNGQKKTYKVAL